jgi:uncharacterized membrane protein YesL
MERLEKYLYLVLTGYLILVSLVFPLIVEMTVHQVVVYTALPFLAWIALSVYYLLRWYVRYSARKPIK